MVAQLSDSQIAKSVLLNNVDFNRERTNKRNAPNDVDFNEVRIKVGGLSLLAGHRCMHPVQRGFGIFKLAECHRSFM